MTRPAVTLAAALALCAAFAAAALAVTPPTGTPSLAAMTIQRSDLGPGSIVSVDAYQTPPAGFVALYERDFRVAQLGAAGTPFVLQTQIQLAPSATLAHEIVTLERAEFGSSAGHRLIELAIVKSAGGKVKASDVRFGRVLRIGPGSGSFDERVTLRLGARTVTSEIIDLGEGPVVALLVAVVPGTRVPSSLSLALARDVDRHTKAVLASTGSTGASGAA